MLKNKGNTAMDKMGDLNTLIGKGSVFKGDLEVGHSLRIDGKLIGNIKSTESIIIGKEGEVEGQIEVKNAVVGGKVKGKIKASGKVTLESTSVFQGELKTSKLVIDEGAVFDGTSLMGNTKAGTPVSKDEVSKQEITAPKP